MNRVPERRVAMLHDHMLLSQEPEYKTSCVDESARDVRGAVGPVKYACFAPSAWKRRSVSQPPVKAFGRREQVEDGGNQKARALHTYFQGSMAYRTRGKSCVDVVRGFWVGQKGEDFGLKADGGAIGVLGLLLLTRGCLEGGTGFTCKQRITNDNWRGKAAYSV